MGLAASTAKHILLLLNFIFTILGLILIGFGIFILVGGDDNQVDHGEKVAGGLVISLGIVILLIAIFGCLAAIHGSRNKLIVYIISLVVLILIQLMMVSMASQGTRDGLAASVKEGFESLWKIEEDWDASAPHKGSRALAYYEDWLHCCGVNNTDDYHRIQHDIPKTCCKDHACRIVDNIYAEGCQKKFKEYLSDKILTFSIVSWILILAEIVAAAIGWILLNKLRNESRRANVGWM